AGTASHLAETTGAWGCGKRSAVSTSPHPPRRPRTIVQRGVTLTFHLVQKIGQVTSIPYVPSDSRSGTVWSNGIELKGLVSRVLLSCSEKWNRFHFVVKPGLKHGNKTSMQVSGSSWQQQAATCIE